MGDPKKHIQTLGTSKSPRLLTERCIARNKDVRFNKSTAVNLLDTLRINCTDYQSYFLDSSNTTRLHKVFSNTFPSIPKCSHTLLLLL